MQYKGFIIDIEGTIIQNGSEIQGSFAFLQKLKNKRIPFRLVTNTVGKSQEEMAANLNSIGFEISSEYIMNPINAINYFLKKTKSSSYFFVGPPSIQSQLAIQPDLCQTPEYVILCDFEYIPLSYTLFNKIFTFLNNGAILLATSYSDYYLSKEGYKLDTGSFTKMFEIICHQKASISGKPSNLLYETAINKMGLERDSVIAVGDDVLTDIMGANDYGLYSVLVRTGKYKKDDEVRITPDLLIDRLELMTEYCFGNILSD